jgi:uncharacterized alkaline shock family protein YloU
LRGDLSGNSREDFVDGGEQEMSEPYQHETDSPLVSERGTTTISDGVVSKIAGISAQEVEGVHMGGSASRTAGGFLGSVTGSESQTRGVSVEVGKVETAIDLKMGIEYGRNVLQSVEEVRRRIAERVQNMTGLRVTELNVTIADIVFPEKEQSGRLGSGNGVGDHSLESADATNRPEARTLPRSELRPGAAERETTEVDPRSRTYTEGASGPIPEEEVRVEGRPLEPDETAELRTGDTASGQPQSGEEAETGTVAETREEERLRRRAEERARRRRQTEDN